ncbi:unnamed protein product [Lampetra planeri]
MLAARTKSTRPAVIGRRRLSSRPITVDGPRGATSQRRRGERGATLRQSQRGNRRGICAGRHDTVRLVVSATWSDFTHSAVQLKRRQGRVRRRSHGDREEEARAQSSIASSRGRGEHARRVDVGAPKLRRVESQGGFVAMRRGTAARLWSAQATDGMDVFYFFTPLHLPARIPFEMPRRLSPHGRGRTPLRVDAVGVAS